jgi:hypothetical protein
MNVLFTNELDIAGFKLEVVNMELADRIKKMLR